MVTPGIMLTLRFKILSEITHRPYPIDLRHYHPHDYVDFFGERAEIIRPHASTSKTITLWIT